MTEAITFDSLKEQMAGFTKMTTPLPFPEFQQYFNDCMAFLQSDYQGLDSDQLITFKSICGIMGAHAQQRSFAKDNNRKKFQKMAEKCAFWEKAISLRLHKDGFTDDEVSAKEEALWD